MTGEQKQRIQDMRQRGSSYADIASAVGLTKNSVKTFCWRNNLTACDASNDTGNEDNKDTCKHCGKKLRQKSKQKPKTFCDDACRLAWWRKHRDKLDKKAVYKLTCAHCGKVFDSYGNKERKFCSHDCYINHRYYSDADLIGEAVRS